MDEKEKNKRKIETERQNFCENLSVFLCQFTAQFKHRIFDRRDVEDMRRLLTIHQPRTRISLSSGSSATHQPFPFSYVIMLIFQYS